MDETDLISTLEAAAVIGCSRRSIENYRRRGRLHPIRLANGRILFVRQEVESLREKLLNPSPHILVQASQAELWGPKKSSYQPLPPDPDPSVFTPKVWEAVRRYQEARKAR